MLLTDLIADLRLDLSDSGAALFEDLTLERCARKAVFRVGKDLQIDFVIRSNSRILPTPEDAVRELMIILSQVHACQVMRAASANAFSFSSGDKRVDKTSQPGHWAKLEADLLADYREQLGELRPETQIDEESYIITPSNLSPLIYGQGKRRRCC
ncbi:MAG: hypothetical protein HKP58_03900 [Desulfatitalea sp.]|nr:hypothetical protein [Desulfatitalea sp.]NNJ99536.1 hypothetical protein [Desulfatitalea sp.]